MRILCPLTSEKDYYKIDSNPFKLLLINTGPKAALKSPRSSEKNGAGYSKMAISKIWLDKRCC